MTQTVRRRPAHADRAHPHRSRSKRKRRSAGGVYVLLLTLAVVFVGPILWLLLAALKTREEWVAVPTKVLPEQAQWSNFVHALTDINFPAYAMNSLFLATVYAVLITISSAMVGFGFARLRAPANGPCSSCCSRR
nr:hypothetical protein GCM10020093_006800 [Planobispora longispora]